MAELSPSDEAYDALRSSERSLRDSDRVIAEAEETAYAPLRSYLLANHFADKIRAQFQGV